MRAVALLAAVSGTARLGAVMLLARAVARLTTSSPSLGAGTLAGAAAVIAVSAGAAAAARFVADRASTAAKERLQDRVVVAATGHGTHVDDRLAGLLTGGLDRLDGFVARQWPARARAVAVPLVALTVLLVVDWRAALVALALLPAAPLLAWVIGARTASEVRRTWRAAGRLGGTFLDSVAGVMTLKLYGRPDERAARIEAASEQHRRLTLRVLRTAVLSSAATGLVSTMAIGLVAVVCGTRVLSGELGLATALTAILVVPEVFRAPLAAAGGFHTEAEVAAVLGDVEALLAGSAPPPAAAASGEAGSGDAVLDGVTVAYPGRGVLALGPVTGRFAPGTVTAVRGRSGAGKSTLLRVAAGLVAPTSGATNRPTGLGYLPQQPSFPQARTVRDAVRGGLTALSDAEVRTALHAAAAEAVADEAYGGLDRPLEAFGPSLSTGELRLVALARAYAAAGPSSLLVLDEPTAHLDPATERLVLERLLARAREHRLVVLMAAHRPAALAAADRVVDLPDPPTAEPPGATTPASADLAPGPASRRAAEEDQPADQPVPRARRTGRWLPAAAVACGVLSALCGLALTATATALLVRAADRPPLLALSLYIVAVRAFALGRPALRYCERLLAHDAAFRELTRRRMQVWSLLVPRIPGRGLPASGELLTRIARDVDDEVDATLRGVHAGTVLAVTAVAAVAGLAVLAPATAAVAAAGVVAVSAAAWLADRTALARLTGRQQSARAARDGAAVDVLVGLDDLVGNGGPAAAASVARRATAALHTTGRRVVRVETAVDTLVTVATGLLPFAALWAVLATGTRPSPVPAAAGVLVVAALAELLDTVPDVARALRLRSAAAARRLALADVPVPTVRGFSAEQPGSAQLSLDEVSASWGHPDEAVLDGVSLTLPTGRRLAVTGRSGSGKSTLVAVAAHLLAPAAGSARLGGVDYRVLDPAAVRRQVAVVGLADHVFADTVRGNLSLGEAFADGELVDTLDRVRLGEWLATLPDGLDTSLGSRAATVSGGEARRLALARALLRRPAVLVLDEPVEGLDSPTAQAVLRDLSERDPGLSWLLLAHRPEGLDLVDETWHLAGGRLTAVAP